MKPENESKLSRSRILRIIFLVIGIISLALGTIGIFLPIIPTVPLYLLTAFCFVRGNERFANWFLNSKLYLNHMGNFVNHRVMTVYGEMILLVSVTAMLLVSLWLIDKPVMSVVFVVLIAIKYLYFVFRITPIGRKEYLQIKENDRKEKEGND